jgi:hypothetical protein
MTENLLATSAASPAKVSVISALRVVSFSRRQFPEEPKEKTNQFKSVWVSQNPSK